MSAPKVVRWGILAIGGIARKLTRDLLIDQVTRKMVDIKHVVAAVASSTLSPAKHFVSDVVSPYQSLKCIPYLSYEDLMKDPSVDIVYIATPHSHHYQNAMLCLSNNKPALCEKPLTVNAAQAKMPYKTAKENNFFSVEAAWTCFFPISRAIRKHITDNDIGEVSRMTSDLSIGATPEESFDSRHRMVNLDLVDGCLLDLGITVSLGYSI